MILHRHFPRVTPSYQRSFFKMATIAMAFLLSSLQLRGQKFEVLEDMPTPSDLSADGSIILGSSPSTRLVNGVLDPLPIPTGLTGSPFFKMSGDGMTLAGDRYIWKDGVHYDLGLRHTVFALSPDGRVAVVRYINENNKYRFYRWVEGVIEALPDAPEPLLYVNPSALNWDGSEVIGTLVRRGTPQRNIVFGLHWQGGAPIPLPFDSALDISEDGKIIVGDQIPEGSTQRRAVKWEGGVVTDLGTAHPNQTYASAHGVSADGATIVGDYAFTGSGFQAFIWTEKKGMQDLKEFLETEHGVDLSGWTLERFTRISADGRVLIGRGKNADGNRGWKAELSGVSLDLKIPSGKFEPGEIITAKVRVQSLNKDPVTITFSQPPLTIDPLGLKLVDDSLVVEPFILGNGNRAKTVEVQLTPTKNGTWRVLASATAQTIDGPVELSDEEYVIVSPLDITVEALPEVGRTSPDGPVIAPIVNMEVEEDPENPGTYIITDKGTGIVVQPKVKVTVKNISAQTVTASLQGLDARARDKKVVGARVKTVGEFPDDLGSILPEASVTREYDLDIRDDGRFEFIALATGISEGASKQFNASGKGAPIAVGDAYPVEIELKFVRTPDITKNNNGGFFLKPGSSLKVIASVINHTSNSTLNFYGLETVRDLRGNAFGGTLTSIDGNLKEPPVADDHEIPAGGFAQLSTTILTDPIGASSGIVKWQLPDENQINLIETVTQEKTEVSSDDILITGTLGSWLGDDLTIKLFQDRRLPDVPVLSGLEWAGNFSGNALIGMGDWVYDSFVGVGALLAKGVHDPSAIFVAMGAGGQSIYNFAEMAAITWQNMSPEEKLEYAKYVGEETVKRALLYHFIRSPLTPQEAIAAKEAAQQATYVFFSDVEDAYASNDPLRISAICGKITGNTALEIATAGIPTPKFTKFTRGVEALRLATNTKAAKFISKTETYLRTVKGPISFLNAARFWGIGGRELKGVQEVLGALGMKGYARERSPKAIQLIETLKEAIWKPEKMKPKGISEIDRYLIGEEKVTLLNSKLMSLNTPNQTVDIDGITAIFKPDSDADILARLNGQPQHIKDAVIERARYRMTEYNEYRSKFKEWKKPLNEGGGIPVDFNYSGNASTRPSGIPAEANRQFTFENIGTIENPVLIPRMADDAGILKYISGDTDWIHFCWLDGTPLNEETAAALYMILSRCCGLQHGETISWINKGQTVFKNKINQLSDYLQGAKALLEVTGDSLRAVRINPNYTFFAPDGRGHLIFFDEGTKVLRQLRDDAHVSTFLANISDGARFRYLLNPGNWYQNSNTTEGSINGRDWSFNHGQSSIIIRKSVDDDLERFDGTNWIPFDLNSATGKMALSPLTTLSDEAKSGETKLEIFDLSLLEEDELSDRLDSWYEVGQTIVIAPGELTQEIQVISQLGSLILENPLQHDHPAGTAVALIPPGMIVDESGNNNRLDTLDSHLSQDGTIFTITWTSVTDGEYIIESASSLATDDWTSVGEVISTNSSTTRRLLQLPFNSERLFIRVKRVDQ